MPAISIFLTSAKSSFAYDDFSVFPGADVWADVETSAALGRHFFRDAGADGWHRRVGDLLRHDETEPGNIHLPAA